MRKLNKQDLIYVGIICLYILVTFKLYLLVRQYFIIDVCNSFLSPLGGPGYLCFGYLHLFDNISIYLYILFLWITVIPFIKRKYLFPNNTIFITGIVIFILYILYIYTITPIVYLDDIGTGETWFSHK